MADPMLYTGNSSEVDGKIYALLICHLSRGFENYEHQRNQSYSHKCEHHAHYHRGGNERVSGFADVFPVVCTEIVGYDDAGTCREPGEEAYDKVCHRSQCADGRKRVLAYEVSHNPGVYGVVKLLEEHPQKNRNCEIDNLRDNGTTGHVDFSFLADSQ